MFHGVYNKRRVLVTGHTGFKGSWLSLWLRRLGAEVAGFSDTVPTKPNHHDLIDVRMTAFSEDIRDFEALHRAFEVFRPEIVFHLAAQSLVGYSYDNPLETFQTNVIGTLNIFEVARRCESVRAIVNVTSDKCYENREWVWGYRENEPLGGRDPYSASKGCVELLTNSYRDSFFPVDRFRESHHILLASARAGNVIGGGDWGSQRLVPDIMRATGEGKTVRIRSPHSVRPWQHVLEPLSGYLLLGEKLLNGQGRFADAWNFGPDDYDHHDVMTVVKAMQNSWSDVSYSVDNQSETFHEAKMLKLDCSKARSVLQWRPVWKSDVAFQKTAQWYRSFYKERDVISEAQLNEYIDDALNAGFCWTAS